MRYLTLLVAVAVAFFSVQLVGSAATWQPASATNITAGAVHQTFVVHALATLPNACYAARIRSTPISLHTPRQFFVEQLAPSSKCTKGTAAYTCTVVSPDFPLPIPGEISVISKGPRTTQVPVITREPSPAPPLCRTS